MIKARPIGEVVLSVENISLAFGGVKALTEVSFDVREHEVRAIIGPNGAGKSSMLNVINGVYHPQQGTIRFLGRSTHDMDPHEAAERGLARTFQSLALFKGMSVLENILTGRNLRMKSNILMQALRIGPALAGRAVAGFTAALTELLADLATQLIKDGEGVHHVVTIDVRGAASERAAAAVARRIATSPLVKTAIAGGDPNWGRVLCAIGNAGVPIDPTRLGLRIGAVEVVKRGAVAPGYDEAQAAAVMQTPAYTITADLGGGKARARVLACDLSHEYVSINADYRS